MYLREMLDSFLEEPDPYPKSMVDDREKRDPAMRVMLLLYYLALIIFGGYRCITHALNAFTKRKKVYRQS
jgi:hypothetical protein